MYLLCSEFVRRLLAVQTRTFGGWTCFLLQEQEMNSVGPLLNRTMEAELGSETAGLQLYFYDGIKFGKQITLRYVH